MERRTFALIDLNKIAHNIRELKRCAGTAVLAVVKADAYGHGLAAVAQTAYKEGVRHFAVATPDEAQSLRQLLPEGDVMILILSPVEDAVCAKMVACGVSLCVFTKRQVQAAGKAAAALGVPARVHIKLDTGMGRVGLRTDAELEDVLEAVRQNPGVQVEGLFTHFATADEADKSFTALQLEKYRRWQQQVLAAGHKPICHASNSAAILEVGEAHMDLCRMGISMYGYMPSGEVDASLAELQPAMSLFSYISHIKTIEAGESVSYGRTFIAKRPTKVATVPVGYADGYRRGLSGKASAIVMGKMVPLIGRVCMDQIMLDVTGLDVNEGDTVLLMGEENGVAFTADDMAACCDTISYEIICGFSARVPRVYV
ncbi:MAG: alanine racemase [Christensenellaceae bacterium]|nr:alanine racemase [Christensenellaceae bacterium]